MEKLREWKDKINRTDWSSRARCVMGREGWREERAWLGRAFWGEALLGGCWEAKEPAGWRLQMAADAWGWEEGGAWPRVHVVGMVAAGQARWGCSFGMKSEQRIWGKSGQFEATMRVGVVLLGGWSAIGSRLDGGWNHPQLEQLLLPSLAADTSSSLPGSFAPQNLFKRARHSTSSNTLFTITTLLSPAPSSYIFFPSLQRHPTGAPKPGLTMPAPQPPKRCLNQPPTAIPAMLSTLLSPFQLVPGFLRLDMSELLINFRGCGLQSLDFLQEKLDRSQLNFSDSPYILHFRKAETAGQKKTSQAELPIAAWRRAGWPWHTFKSCHHLWLWSCVPDHMYTYHIYIYIILWIFLWHTHFLD